MCPDLCEGHVESILIEVFPKTESNASNRVTMNSCTQIDILMSTDVQRFDSTTVYPFSSSNHHLIVSHFYARTKHGDPPPLLDITIVVVARLSNKK